MNVKCSQGHTRYVLIAISLHRGSVCLLMGSKSLWVEQVRDLFSQVPELKRQLPDLFIVLPAYVTPFLYVQIIEWRMFAFCGVTCL